jgi:hypothetical protein
MVMNTTWIIQQKSKKREKKLQRQQIANPSKMLTISQNMSEMTISIIPTKLLIKRQFHIV